MRPKRSLVAVEKTCLLAPTGAQGVILSVRVKVEILHLSSTNLQAVSQLSVSHHLLVSHSISPHTVKLCLVTHIILANLADYVFVNFVNLFLPILQTHFFQIL